ncbi:MAG: hypothetical protein E6H03_06960, partial [Bacillati bacterium ANGP1]
MNYYDEHGVEEALRIKERLGGTVTLLTAGPARAALALRSGLAMGADAAVHIVDPALEGADHLGVATALAAAISVQHYDLILCGKLATDDNAAIVGPALAEFLGFPQATAVTKLELGDGAATVHREAEGAIEVLRVALLAVITVERSINEPRYPSLPGIMKAKRTPVTTKTLGDLGLAPGEVGVAAARVEVLDLSPPPQRRAGRILQGEPAEMVKELVRLLHEEAMSSDIWVLAEYAGGRPRKITYELLGKASALAQEAGGQVVALALGSGIAGAAQELAAYGADVVRVADDPLLGQYTTDAYAAVIEPVVSVEESFLLMIGSTAMGRDLAPRLAARLGAGIVTDCATVEVVDGGVEATRPVMTRKAIARVAFRGDGIRIAVVLPNIFAPPQPDPSRVAEVLPISVALDPASIRTQVLEVKAIARETLPLTEADIIVSGGRGLRGP